jgi:hypothetical protein
MQPQSKAYNLVINMDRDRKNAYKALCKREGFFMADDVRAFIDRRVAAAERPQLPFPEICDDPLFDQMLRARLINVLTSLTVDQILTRQTSDKGKDFPKETK